MISDFFPIKNDLINNNIDKVLNSLIQEHKYNLSFKIDKISSLENIKSNSILFLKNKYPKINMNNVHIITNNKSFYESSDYENISLVTDIDQSYNIIINHIFHHEDDTNFFDDFLNIGNSYISKYAYIHNSSKIFNNCVIGRGVKIGKNCIIKNNVVIKNSIIGDDVVISDNSTIGSTGFGFDLKKMGSKHLSPQIGIVIVESGVYIGSNCSIDRGKIDETIIGKNSMLDNQIHIAHNVILGESACIAAQVGISGSVKIGKNIIIGGQSGFAGHIKIGDNVIVAAKSGVTKNLASNSIVAGFPAVDIKDWKKSIIKFKNYGYK